MLIHSFLRCSIRKNYYCPSWEMSIKNPENLAGVSILDKLFICLLDIQDSFVTLYLYT